MTLHPCPEGVTVADQACTSNSTNSAGRPLPDRPQPRVGAVLPPLHPGEADPHRVPRDGLHRQERPPRLEDAPPEKRHQGSNSMEMKIALTSEIIKHANHMVFL